MFRKGSNGWWAVFLIIGFGWFLFLFSIISLMGAILLFAVRSGSAWGIVAGLFVVYVMVAFWLKWIFREIGKSDRKLMMVPKDYRPRLEITDNGSELVYPSEQEYKSMHN